MNSAKRDAILAVVVGLIAVSATRAFAGVITVDEFGNGLPSQIFLEPIPGTQTLMYFLPFPGVAGDVLIMEQVGGIPEGAPSDLIRFDGAGHMFFFSDRAEENTVPPDVGLPALQPGWVTISELGVEGNNSAVWIPGTGQPGFDPSIPQYTFISDVPETGVLPALVGTLLAAGGVEFRRHLSRKAA